MRNFRTWCEKNGFDPRVSNAISLGIKLRRFVPDIETRRERHKEHGAVIRKISGISLREGEF
jgi:hypothetical protein